MLQKPEFVLFTVCLPGWTSHGGHCYRAFKPKKSWADADIHCHNLNSDLMSIHSEDEHQLGKSLFTMDADYIWIGLRFLEKDVQMDKNQWSDGSSVNFTKWKNGHSVHINHNHDHCASYDKNSALWVQKSCSNAFPYVCKRKGR